MKTLLKNGFLAVVMALCALAAKADITFYVYVDNPDLVTIRSQMGDYKVVQGMNKYTSPGWDYLSFNTTNGSNAYFKSVTKNGIEQLSSINTYYSTSISESDNNAVFTVSTVTGDELCTASFTCTVDNPARLANMSVGGTPYTNYGAKSFEANVPRIIKFNPDSPSPVRVSLNANGAPLYRVTLNGEDVESDSYGNVGFNPSEGDNVMIYCDYPDEMSKVTFDLKNDADKLLSQVYIYGDASSNYSKTPVEFTLEGFEVPRGSQVIIEHVGGYKNFIFNSYTAGSRTFSQSQTCQFYVTSDMTVAIDAQLSEEYEISLDIDNIDAMLVSRGSYGGEVVTGLASGENKVKMYNANSELSLRKYSGHKVVSATKNGEAISPSWDGKSFNTYVDAGDKIVVRTEPIETYKTYITVDDPSHVVVKRFYSTSMPERIIELKEGRNEIVLTGEDDEARNVHIFPADGCYINSVKLNGEDVERDNWSGYFKIESGADYEAIVSSEVIDRSDRYVLYIDNTKAKNLSSVNWAISNGTKTQADIATGYNVRNFFHGDNYFKVSAYYDYGTEVTAAYYLNGEKIEYESYGTNAEAKMNLKDGDVVRLYMTTASPESYKVKFTTTDSENPKVAGDVRFADVVRDMIVGVDEPAEEVTVLQGTSYEFTVDSSAATEKVTYAVTVNGTEVEPDENGVYHLDVNADTEVNLVYDMVPYTDLYLVGDFNGWGDAHGFNTDNGVDYEIAIEALAGQFKIVDSEWNDYVFGGNGQPVVLDTPMTLVNGSNSNLTLADSGASDLKFDFNLATSTLTVSGTAGIGTVVYDVPAEGEAYYTLQGIRVNGKPSAGVYIRVADGSASKVTVQ